MTVAQVQAQTTTSALGQISLVDLLDRLLGTGVVLAGDVTISLAGVDLVQLRLYALLTSVKADLDTPSVAEPDRGSAP